MTDSIFDRPEFNSRLFFPRGDESPAPAGAEDLLIDVPKGARLHARWHRGDPARPTLLLFHGNGEVVCDYDDAADSFARAGVNLAVVDFRGYGASTGVPTLRDAIEDARVVLDRFVARGVPLLVMGRSLGGACAAELYQDAPDAVLGFVWESCFVDLRGLILRRGLRPPDAFEADDARVFDPLPKLRRGTKPLLILHGADDDLIVPDEARVAHAEAGASRKELVFVPGRGHNDLSLEGVYWSALTRFVASLR